MKYWLVFTGMVGVIIANGQVKRQFNVENSEACTAIKLCFKANSANCYVKPSHGNDILNVFSNQDADSYSHTFQKEIKNKVCQVSLSLEEQQSSSLGQTISARMFGPEESSHRDKFWKMYLSDQKPYALEMTYGVGNANVDLSGLSVNKLKINTGSADVKVGYFTLENRIDMDTFFVKTDLGSVNVENINLSRSRVVVAEVGFGNMTLDFGGQPLVANIVRGSVGAGNLLILLPETDVPVIVRVHDSWLCSISLPESMKKISENTFANKAYQIKANPSNTLTFDLDVSMGKIIFKEAR